MCERTSKGEYACACGGAGWAPGPGSQSCLAPGDPCIELGHRCGGEASTFNRCVDLRDGTYACACRAKGWSLTAAGDGCICPDPCTKGDPCRTAFDGGNTCASAPDPEPGTCAQHTCTCGGEDWEPATVDGRSVCRRRDPCTSKVGGADPCLQNAQGAGAGGNVCVTRIDASTGFPESRRPFECRCQAPYFALSPDGLSCQAADPCEVGDPCATRFGVANSCASPDAATFTCSCDQPGYCYLLFIPLPPSRSRPPRFTVD